MKKPNLEPLAPRTKEASGMPKTFFAKAVSVLSPQIVYYVLGVFVTQCGAIALTNQDTGDNSAWNTFVTRNSTTLAFVIRLLAVVVAVLPLLEPLKDEALVYFAPKEKKPGVLSYVYTVLAAVGMAVFFNVLFKYVGITQASESYDRVSQSQYSLPLWAGLFLYGLVTPLAEEIVHRGLIYNRLRRYFNLPAAMLFSPLIFAISHRNLPQFLYAFLMGLVICVIYEKYGAFIFPVLFHMAANIFVYTVSRYEAVNAFLASQAVMSIMGIMSLVMLFLILCDGNPKAESEA